MTLGNAQPTDSATDTTHRQAMWSASSLRCVIKDANASFWVLRSLPRSCL
jgi:hypothetical protein